MYQNPDQFDQQINYGFVFTNGVSKKSSITLENSPRMLYFLEGLFNHGREQEVMSYLKWKSIHLENSQRLKRISLERSTRKTSPPGILQNAQAYTLQKKYVLDSLSSTPVLQQDQKFSGVPRE